MKKSKSWKRTPATFIVMSVVFGLITATYLFAYLWGVMAGFKTHTEVIMEPFSFPKTWQWQNYIDVFTMLEVYQTNMIGMIGNSLILALIGPILTIGGSGILAYAVSKYKFPGRNILLAINVVVITLPIIGTSAATYRLFYKLGMINSPLLLINHIGCFGANFLYMLSCFNGVSNTYMEAAQIDGAGHYTVMFKIMLPMAWGTMSALWILQLVGVWNDTQTALLYWPKKPTLATGIYLFNQDMAFKARMDILLAATILSSIPPLILFAFFHKTILANVTFGGIKG